jgi:hypothetical protein
MAGATLRMGGRRRSLITIAAPAHPTYLWVALFPTPSIPLGMPTARRLFAILLFGVIVLEPVGPASAMIPPGRYAIGDSVMLGAKDELTGRGIKVNAVVSRQFRDAIPLVEQLKAAGRLRKKVIIHLGNNGILIEAAQCNRISEVAGPQPDRVSREPQDPAFVSEHPERAIGLLRTTTRQHRVDRLVPLQPEPPLVVRGRRLPPHLHRSDELRVLDRDDDGLIGSTGRIGRLVSVACPSGRRDTPGKRVGGLTPSRVRIPRPPLPTAHAGSLQPGHGSPPTGSAGAPSLSSARRTSSKFP